MKLTGSNDFLISLICLLFIIICQYSVFGQKDSGLLDKLKTASLLNVKGKNSLFSYM
jgi:hypothetical protein